MVAKIRRVVTGVNEKGESVVQFDGEAQNILLFSSYPGAGVTDLWVTSEIPVDNRGDVDRGTLPFKHDPDPNGTIFRIVELPPEEKSSAAVDMDAAMDSLGSKNKLTAQERTKHPTMHFTDSIDYLVVISGELTMIMDVGEVTLKGGDCIVQRGTRHGWANRGDQPVIFAAVLVEAIKQRGH
ncbi:MAG: cupin domain-containing protein [Deltaproteobacteria bacterium]|nr:cupin domain-containing protein [Deltaproteobacteria bacterium]